MSAPPEQVSAMRHASLHRLSLRAKGGLTLAGLVLYVVLVGTVISHSRDKQLAMVEELERTHRLEEMLVQVNMAVARAILTVNDNYVTPEPADAVQPVDIEIEAVQSNLAGLRPEFPVIDAKIAGLQAALEHLRKSPSRGDIALLRSELHDLVGVLDGITSGARAKKERLLAGYRVAQDMVTLEIIVFSLIGLIVLGVLTALFFTQLAWDIRNVASRAIAIVHGYRGQHLTISRGDEVGELMAALNNMQTELREREAQLELSRQQHFHKEKMAAVGSLAAQLAHEINNPIAAISGVAQSISDVRQSHHCPNHGVVCQPELIMDQAKRVALITRQIAEFTSPQSAEPQLLDLNGLVRSTCNFVSYDRRFKNIELRTELDLQLPAVNAVGDHLSQVLMNLLINAADAMDGVHGRKPTIVVATRAGVDRIVVTVEDNGHGMSEEVLRRAFNEFYTTKAAGRGSGLGLALCKNLMETCGGSIRLDSRVAAGTTVTLELPLGLETRAAA